MSNIDKQATREKFEAWAEEAGALPWGHLKKQRTASGNYSVQIYTYMWHAWNACHEALLDELEADKEQIKTLESRNRRLEGIINAAERRIAEQSSQKRLIGWRASDYTDETADPELAKNWDAAIGVLPIFEGDVNTKLGAAGIGEGE